MSEISVILTDLSLKPIALDRNAVAILGYPNHDGSDIRRQMLSMVPREVLEQIRHAASTDARSFVTTFGARGAEYVCRIYFMESYNQRGAEPIVAFLIERRLPDNHDSIYEVAAQFNLTERESVVLGWVSRGLTDKEVADKMNISPNTVKCFVRLIMIKMGVSTRTSIIAKILAHNNNARDMANTCANPYTI
jgi:DNA-binding NarL/FixJ family response regulator